MPLIGMIYSRQKGAFDSKVSIQLLNRAMIFENKSVFFSFYHAILQTLSWHDTTSIMA